MKFKKKVTKVQRKKQKSRKQKRGKKLASAHFETLIYTTTSACVKHCSYVHLHFHTDQNNLPDWVLPRIAKKSEDLICVHCDEKN